MPIPRTLLLVLESAVMEVALAAGVAVSRETPRREGTAVRWRCYCAPRPINYLMTHVRSGSPPQQRIWEGLRLRLTGQS